MITRKTITPVRTWEFSGPQDRPISPVSLCSQFIRHQKVLRTAILLGSRLLVFGILGKTFGVTTQGTCFLISWVTITSSVQGQAAAARDALLNISNSSALDIPFVLLGQKANRSRFLTIATNSMPCDS